MVWTTYKEKIKRLSQRIVEAQKPIRILDAIKWDAAIEVELKRSKFKSMPKLGADYYKKSELGFDPDLKLEELATLAKDIESTLGVSDQLGQLMKGITEQYMDVVNLLLNRGTKEFWTYSKKLYGSPKDRFHDEDQSIRDLGETMYSILSGLDDRSIADSKLILPITRLKRRFLTGF
jgi:hypothetical protein